MFGTARITMHFGGLAEAILRDAPALKRSQGTLATVTVLDLNSVVLEMTFERPSHVFHRLTDAAAHLDERSPKRRTKLGVAPGN